MATNIRDPRSIITPDAFRVSDEMLGLPLARPKRRFWSIVIDLIVISFITIVTSDFSLIIWGVVGLFFLQMALRKPSDKFGNVTGWLFRGATGCLGFIVLSGVVIGWLAISFGEDAIEEAAQGFVEGAGVEVPAAPGTEGAASGLGESLSALGNMGAFGAAVGRAAVGQELAAAEGEQEASEILFEVLDISYETLDMRGPQLVALAGSLVSDDAEFTDDPEAFRTEVVEAWATDRGVDLEEEEARIAELEDDEPAAAPGDSSDDPGVDPLEIAESVAALSPPQVMAEWADRMQVGDTLDSDYRAVAVRARATELIAADTLEALGRTARRLENQLESTREDLAGASAELEEAQSGFVALLRDIWDQLGSAFGLWSIYFTVMLTLFRGRTVGKFVTRTRVVRLDGQPLNWWAAFERCGGYFAGIATGLMGFAQVYWDPNRQCVHDKIVGTAVVMDGQVAEPGAWQQAAGLGDPE